ncbi:hypothetical protein M3Y94_00546800 [Aphelenchoides besseyi]|nr:hypothetical protein M3Y94_00546800 [Aphelenchoides besseyi]KAI6225706.1 hypothetical protein M3Y95_00725400 [Aphelenchoides besseyi]
MALMEPTTTVNTLNDSQTSNGTEFIDLHDLPFAFQSSEESQEDLVLIDEIGDSSSPKVNVVEDDDIQIIAEVKGNVNDHSARKRKAPPVALSSDSEIDPEEVQIVGVKRSRITVQSAADSTITQLLSAYRTKFPKKFLHFDQQIMRFFEKHVQNDVTYAWKMKARDQLQSCIRQVFPNARLFAVGSTVNGCGSYDSDMDLCCVVSGYIHDGNLRSFGIRTLRKIRKHLFQSYDQEIMNKCEFIQAKVPILRIEFKDRFNTLQVDLNINNEAGIRNSHLLHYYSRVDDRFPALCLLIKHWAKEHGIADAAIGFLNSYSLILLCLHYLQAVVSPPILPNLQTLFPEQFSDFVELNSTSLFLDLERRYPDPKLNTMSVGELLIGMFDYYSKFDFDNWAISVRKGRTFKRCELCSSTDRFCMFIEEPYDLNNTARCVTDRENFDVIMETFRSARRHFLGKKKPDLRSIVKEVMNK